MRFIGSSPKCPSIKCARTKCPSFFRSLTIYVWKNEKKKGHFVRGHFIEGHLGYDSFY